MNPQQILRLAKRKVHQAGQAYVAHGRPLLPLTRGVRAPLRWWYHRTPTLKHDVKPSVSSQLLSFLHDTLVGDHPHDFRIYGNKIKFHSHGSTVSVHGYYLGEFEYHLVQFVVSQLRPNFVMLDVGAHHGVFSLIAAYELKKRGWKGHIYAFEADATNFDFLKQNVRQNGLEEFITVRHSAVADRSGDLTLMVYGADNSCNSLVSTDENGATQSRRDVSLVTVEGVALDSLMETIPHVDLIKMDIQCAEPLALVGAEELIARDRPVMVIEAMQGYASTDETRQFLLDHQYSIHGIDVKGQLVRPNSSEAFVSWDWVAMPL